MPRAELMDRYLKAERGWKGRQGWETFCMMNLSTSIVGLERAKRVIRGQAREIKRGQKREGEMQHVRNVRSAGDTWPWQLESNAELLGFCYLFCSVLHLKLHYVEETCKNNRNKAVLS